jgi:hypothetical protein
MESSATEVGQEWSCPYAASVACLLGIIIQICWRNRFVFSNYLSQVAEVFYSPSGDIMLLLLALTYFNRLESEVWIRMLVLVLVMVLFLMRMMARGFGTVEEVLKVVMGMEEDVELSEAELQSPGVRVVAGREENLNVAEVGPQFLGQWVVVQKECLGEVEVWLQPRGLSGLVRS